jgi:AAA15 family ATPase/GTPase
MPIYNLGDGIQSIIAITMPLFLQESILENKNILVCIEEPEHLLHPSLQRKLIETFFDKRFDNYQFFFTTHSNHFLDVVLDFDEISMFSFNKKLDGIDEEELAQFAINKVSVGI